MLSMKNIAMLGASALVAGSLTSVANAQMQGVDEEGLRIIQDCVDADPSAPQACIKQGTSDLTRQSIVEQEMIFAMMGEPMPADLKAALECLIEPSGDIAADYYEFLLQYPNPTAAITASDADFQLFKDFATASLNALSACAAQHAPDLPVPDLQETLDSFDFARQQAMPQP